MRRTKPGKRKLVVSTEKVRELDKSSLDKAAGGELPVPVFQTMVHTFPCNNSYGQ